MKQQEILNQILVLILLDISSLTEVDMQWMGIGELTEQLRLYDNDIYDDFVDLQITVETMDYLQSDNQLKSNAFHFWQEQISVFKGKLMPIISEFLADCNRRLSVNYPLVKEKLNLLIEA